MENQLVRTDKVTFKIKRFFRCLFIKRYSRKLEKAIQEEEESTKMYLEKVISCKTEAQVESIRKQLAEKLLKTELSIKDLADEEIQEMIEYFKKDIKDKTEELSNIKKEISDIKKGKA